MVTRISIESWCNHKNNARYRADFLWKVCYVWIAANHFITPCFGNGSTFCLHACNSGTTWMCMLHFPEAMICVFACVINVWECNNKLQTSAYEYLLIKMNLKGQSHELDLAPIVITWRSRPDKCLGVVNPASTNGTFSSSENIKSLNFQKVS